MQNAVSALLKRTPLVAAFAAFLTLAACDDDSTSPDITTADPEAARAVMDSVVQSYFEDNPSVLSANGPLGGFITAITGVQPAISPAFGLASGGDRLSATRGVTMDGVRLFDTVSLGDHLVASSIPVDLVGATCIWNFDPVTPNWLDDTSRSGLCGTGNCIRFVLYPLGVDLLPASQTEAGYMDITDETVGDGTGGQNVDVKILSQFEGATRLDYGVTGTLSETGLNLTMSGSVSDGMSSVPLDLTISGNQTSYSTTYALNAGGFDVSYTFAFDETTGLDFLFRIVNSDGDKTEIIVGIDNNGMIESDSRIEFNDETVATISGTSESVTITAVSGSGLTDLQAAGFLSLFGVGEGLFFHLGQLFGFAMANTGNPAFIF